MSIIATTPRHECPPALGSAFARELKVLINQYTRENASNTPDGILANFMASCLDAFDTGVRRREAWYAHRDDKPAQLEPEPPESQSQVTADQRIGG